MMMLVLVGWVATGGLASAAVSVSNGASGPALSEVEGSALSEVEGQKYAGRPLGDVLRELQATGLNIVFSSEIVGPTIKVLAEPNAARPTEVLDEILRPHGLQVRSGPGGALLVVRLLAQTPPPVTVAGQAQAPSPVTVTGQVVTGANKAPVVAPPSRPAPVRLRRAASAGQGERSRTRPVVLRLTPLPERCASRSPRRVF